MTFSFKDIEHSKTVVNDTPLYTHCRNEKALFMHVENYLDFHRVPTFAEFMEAESYLKSEQQKNGQDFIKFIWPEDCEIPQPIISYLGSNDFSLDVLELYAAPPGIFVPTRTEMPSDVKVDWVNADNRDAYLALSAQADKEVSEEFAKQKQPYTQAKFDNPAFRPIVAICSDAAVGSIDLYLKEDSIEIDNFYVDADARHKGIGTALQNFVMDNAEGKTVLLVADAADTAREMYNRQNYTYVSFRYELLKVFK
ncbi:acetyltransferase (GNAT) family protein [Trichococcus patagoniensis]|uniref:Acetyltransferase (GNAT) family protein n=1 Tax=Trichococcus patagoniensis TaxID=382641 RepID=A0A2T5IDB2_9LACT|nr:GNAT family N-acetyltransferase [Trichococcus patagoniensis]PTQ81812.1 acetyltransferase (GNAT) family protein [Trichococcus patagoniensis]